MIRVLSCNAGADTGGVSWGTADAFARHGPDDITVRSSIHSTNYIEYPHDVPWREVGSYATTASVLHVHNTLKTLALVGARKRPFVIHHHGTVYREQAEALNYAVRMRGGRAVCSTLDLLDYGSDVVWVPPAYDPARLRHAAHFGMLERVVTGDLDRTKLRVAHAPTNRAIKSTEAFLRACAHVGVEAVVVERATNAECIRVKATCDAYFDQVQLGYGCNAIEAWALGLPVIAGAQPGTLSRMADTFGDLPFVTAKDDSIESALEVLLNESARAAWAERGRAHFARWHDGRETVRRLAPIYRELAP